MIWPQQYHKEQQGATSEYLAQFGEIDAVIEGIKSGIADIKAGRTTPWQEVVAELGIFAQWKVGGAGIGVTDGRTELGSWRHVAIYLNAQQRVLDVNPESPTDATRGVGDDPIPQRECEHRWGDNWVDGRVSHYYCTREDCGAIMLNSVVYLPQPIDPRSAA